MTQDKSKNKPEKRSEDPYYGLKVIAAFRSSLDGIDDYNKIEHSVLLDYAKNQICRARNVLFRDPIWDSYTEEDIIVEFFSINFEQNKEELDQFIATFKKASQEDLDWFEKMEEEHSKMFEENKKQGLTNEAGEFEDNF